MSDMTYEQAREIMDEVDKLNNVHVEGDKGPTTWSISNWLTEFAQADSRFEKAIDVLKENEERLQKDFSAEESHLPSANRTTAFVYIMNKESAHETAKHHMEENGGNEHESINTFKEIVEETYGKALGEQTGPTAYDLLEDLTAKNFPALDGVPADFIVQHAADAIKNETFNPDRSQATPEQERTIALQHALNEGMDPNTPIDEIPNNDHFKEAIKVMNPDPQEQALEVNSDTTYVASADSNMSFSAPKV